MSSRFMWRRKSRAPSRSAEGSGAGGQAAGPSAGTPTEAGSLGRISRAQARPAGHGVRDAVRAGRFPEHPDPRLDPVSSIAASRPIAARPPSTGRSSRVRPKPDCRSSGPTTVSIPATCCCRRRRRSATPTRSGSVYFDRLFPMGVDAMLEAVDLVKAGKAPRIKQDEAQSHLRRPLHARQCASIDWGKPWQQIDRLIRGCNPAPGAWTTLDGKTMKIFDAKPLPAKDPKGIGGKLGEIVAIDERRLHRRLRRRPFQGSRGCSPPTARRSTPASGRSRPKPQSSHRITGIRLLAEPYRPAGFLSSNGSHMSASQHQ